MEQTSASSVDVAEAYVPRAQREARALTSATSAVPPALEMLLMPMLEMTVPRR